MKQGLRIALTCLVMACVAQPARAASVIVHVTDWCGGGFKDFLYGYSPTSLTYSSIAVYQGNDRMLYNGIEPVWMRFSYGGSWGPVHLVTDGNTDVEMNWGCGADPFAAPPAVLITNWVGGLLLTNDSGIYRDYYVLGTNSLGSNNMQTVTVAPFSSWSTNFQSSNVLWGWSWQTLEGPSGAAGPSALVTTNSGVPTMSSGTNTTPWDRISVLAPAQTNTWVVQPSTAPRSNDYSTATAAAVTQDKNADLRARELQSLLVNDAQASRQEAAGIAETVALAAKQAHSDASTLDAELNKGLGWTWNANISNFSLSASGFNTNFDVPSARVAQVESFVPSLGTIGSVAPTITLPLTAIDARMTDVSLPMSDSRIATWLALVRGFLLFVMTITFLLATFRVLREFAPS